MTDITNYSVYTSAMEKTMQEKLFFLSYIDPANFNTVVDFGCANGVLLQALSERREDLRLIGYDVDGRMLTLASDTVPTAELYDNWNQIPLNEDSKTLLNLSSVIHEVYSYGTKQDVIEFWDHVFATGFDYISIRDMCVKREVKDTTCLPSATEALRAKDEYADRLRDFECVWGPIQTVEQLAHFLLKCDYKANWSRELYENYLPLYLEELFEMVEKHPQYRIEYCEHAPLQFIVDKTRNKFDIDISDVQTHIKLILKRVCGKRLS